MQERREAGAAPRAWALAAVALAASYAALFATLDALPFQDLPNHLARAAIEADALFSGGRRFGAAFAVDLRPRPYVGGDLALAALVSWLGPSVAGRLWVIAVAASLPLALAVWLRTTGHRPATVAMGTLAALYLGTDWFFLSGMHHYRLGLAAVLLALAAGERWLRSGGPGALAAFCTFVATGYLLHLSALVLAGAGALALAAVALARRATTLRRVALGAVPVLALGAWHLAAGGGAPGGARVYGGLRKLPRLVSPFWRNDAPADAVLFVAFAAVCLLLLRRRGARTLLAEPRVVTEGVLALAFLATYAALPFGSGKVFYVDARALPLAAAFALAAALSAADSAPPGRAAAATAAGALCALLAAGNLAVLAVHLRAENAVLRAYRAVAAQVPPGARVLPVATGPFAGHVDVYLHAGTFATVDAGAITPYLFSAGPTGYLHYRTPPAQAPDEFWYTRGDALAPAERAAIPEAFDFLLVKRPYDPARLPLPVEEVARSDAAVLLRIDREPAGAMPATLRD